MCWPGVEAVVELPGAQLLDQAFEGGDHVGTGDPGLADRQRETDR
jgi:hypothetical protein